MASILLRSVKGSPLTHAELDNNFNELDTKKVSYLSSGGVNLPVGLSGSRTDSVGALRINSSYNPPVIEGCYNNNVWKVFNVTGVSGLGGNGVSGVSGPTGPDGISGPTGPTGPDSLVIGPTGPTGPTGPAGANGVNGTNGKTGSVGPTGDIGPPGLTGVTGMTGPLTSYPTPFTYSTTSNSWREIRLGSGVNFTSQYGVSYPVPDIGCFMSGYGYIFSSTTASSNLSVHRDYAANDLAFIGYRLGGVYVAYLSTNIGVTNTYSGWVPAGSNVTITFQTTSDYRFKRNLKKEETNLDKLKNIDVYSFNYKNSSARIDHGFIAHELQEFFPETVSGIKDEIDDDNNPIYQTINYTAMVPQILIAINELTEKVNKLKKWL